MTRRSICFGHDEVRHGEERYTIAVCLSINLSVFFRCRLTLHTHCLFSTIDQLCLLLKSQSTDSDCEQQRNTLLAQSPEMYVRCVHVHRRDGAMCPVVSGDYDAQPETDTFEEGTISAVIPGSELSSPVPRNLAMRLNTCTRDSTQEQYRISMFRASSSGRENKKSARKKTLGSLLAEISCRKRS